MLKRGPAIGALALGVSISACSGSPTSPSQPLPGYVGQWSGSTSQGRPITISISADQRITAMSLGYDFSGCSGSIRFENLDIAIGRDSAGNGGFGHGRLTPEAGAAAITQVQGMFTSSTNANGFAVFQEYTGCRDSFALWTATKR